MLSRRLRVAPGGDPFFSFVKLLLNFDGGITDVKGNTITQQGAPVVANSAADFNGTTDHLYVVDSSPLHFGQSDFCAEIMFEWQSFKGTWEHIFSHDNAFARGWSIYRDPYDGGHINCYAYLNGVIKTFQGPVLALNEPHHFALIRKGVKLRATMDGADVATPLTIDSTEAMPANPLPLSMNGINYDFTVPTMFADGICRGIRLTVGHNRYEAGSFTPPTTFPEF